MKFRERSFNFTSTGMPMNSNIMSSTPNHDIQELDNHEIDLISGGLGFLPAAAIVVAGLAVFNGSYKAGHAMGRAIYLMTHN